MDYQELTSDEHTLDVVVIGAGFAGLYMIHRLRQSGLSARAFEAGPSVGGTWYWNCYPGARCDIDSLQYSYQFSEELQQDWNWTERYATQPEILRYIEHVAERFDLRRDITFNARVTAARFHEDSARWHIDTEPGERISARFLVSAAGCLSATNLPQFEGLGDYMGKTYHTGSWPQQGVDFSGLNVGMIGTGSSGIQCTPNIAAQASQLTVFQRTPNYVVPAWNAPLDPDYVAAIKSSYRVLRENAWRRPTGFVVPYNTRSALEDTPEEQERVLTTFWEKGGLGFNAAYGDQLLREEANAVAARFVQKKVREKINDPVIADKIVPSGIIGSKRICVADGYYESFNRPNVELVDVATDPIRRFTSSGLTTGDRHFDLDAVVFATGFDAFTGPLTRIDIRGRNGLRLADKWANGPHTYLGVSISEFPNFFMINGPGSPSVLSNMVASAEHHGSLIADCFDHMKANDYACVESSVNAEADWDRHVAELVDNTLRAKRDSWYVAANIPGRQRVFMPYAGGVPRYLEECRKVVSDGYAGFDFS
jgi:cyclohexanone monooxygenase